MSDDRKVTKAFAFALVVGALAIPTLALGGCGGGESSAPDDALSVADIEDREILENASDELTKSAYLSTGRIQAIEDALAQMTPQDREEAAMTLVEQAEALEEDGYLPKFASERLADGLDPDQPLAVP